MERSLKHDVIIVRSKKEVSTSAMCSYFFVLLCFSVSVLVCFCNLRRCDHCENKDRGEYICCVFVFSCVTVFVCKCVSVFL